MYTIGQRVMVFPHYDRDVCHLATVADVGVGGWCETGGVYRVRFDSGVYFWCSEDALLPYETHDDEKE